jgi:hypothetical protein
MTSTVTDLTVPVATAERTDHVMRRLLRHRSAQIGLVLLAAYLLFITVGPFLTRHSPSSSPIYQNLADSLQGSAPTSSAATSWSGWSTAAATPCSSASPRC